MWLRKKPPTTLRPRPPPSLGGLCHTPSLARPPSAHSTLCWLSQHSDRCLDGGLSSPAAIVTPMPRSAGDGCLDGSQDREATIGIPVACWLGQRGNAFAGPELGCSESVAALAQPAGNGYSDGGWAREATISMPVAMLAEPAGDGCLDGGRAREAAINTPIAALAKSAWQRSGPARATDL